MSALDAVLDDIAARDVDVIVNLGDICSGPLFPEETADRLMQLGLPTIRGNHERQVLGPSIDGMGPSDRFARARLRPEQLDWLASLPPVLSPRGDMLMVHGTPASDVTYLLETVSESGLRHASEDEIERRLGPTEATLILCGHTHVQRSVRLRDGRLIVNPGSVGLPAYVDDHPLPHVVEAGTPHARYAIVEVDQAGRWAAELVSVEYDWDTAAEIALARGRTDWAVALRTGQAA